MNNINLTHLLFADDILLFVEDNDDYIRNLQFVIHLFENAVGLNINLSKSIISLINVSKERTDLIAKSWGISTQFHSISYLGMPLGGRLRTISFWDNITEKIHKKLSNWKYAYISKGARPYPHQFFFI